MDAIYSAVRKTIKENQLEDWLLDYPWLTGYLGNRASPVWFVAENPSLRGVIWLNAKSAKCSQNLQWNAHAGDWLFRDALVRAGLKDNEPCKPGGWRCYKTDLIKEPELVYIRNEKKRDPNYWKEQSLRWLPVFLLEIELGRPRVLVAVGNAARKILEFWKTRGIALPHIESIPHYSYIMFRPDNRRGLGPGNIRRKKEFISAIAEIKERSAKKGGLNRSKQEWE